MHHFHPFPSAVDDYLIPDPSPFTFTPSSSPVMCRNYSVERDDVIENDEDFIITLSTGDSAVNFPQMAESDTVSVRIEDSSSKSI